MQPYKVKECIYTNVVRHYIADNVLKKLKPISNNKGAILIYELTGYRDAVEYSSLAIRQLAHINLNSFGQGPVSQNILYTLIIPCWCLYHFARTQTLYLYNDFVLLVDCSIDARWI